ncbi:Mga helix-turn-helix domain-containing protein [Pilibacter termitis]|uniref:Mga helix-turn-helix domain-containing protein n=1 Tax=Pilibacter termitis TaxID=263852 RepID=A0A1T4LX95_9ENTE|nr:helix-turn-helix domain-containing protein [Pilibacter termitis]SJZ59084.1 Mga helix-turn-helix domain-containing protein [Pilibacter termitis]
MLLELLEPKEKIKYEMVLAIERYGVASANAYWFETLPEFAYYKKSRSTYERYINEIDNDIKDAGIFDKIPLENRGNALFLEPTSVVQSAYLSNYYLTHSVKFFLLLLAFRQEKVELTDLCELVDNNCLPTSNDKEYKGVSKSTIYKKTNMFNRRFENLGFSFDHNLQLIGNEQQLRVQLHQFFLSNAALFFAEKTLPDKELIADFQFIYTQVQEMVNDNPELFGNMKSEEQLSFAVFLFVSFTRINTKHYMKRDHLSRYFDIANRIPKELEPKLTVLRKILKIFNPPAEVLDLELKNIAVFFFLYIQPLENSKLPFSETYSERVDYLLELFDNSFENVFFLPMENQEREKIHDILPSIIARLIYNQDYTRNITMENAYFLRKFPLSCQVARSYARVLQKELYTSALSRNDAENVTTHVFLQLVRSIITVFFKSKKIDQPYFRFTPPVFICVENMYDPYRNEYIQLILSKHVDKNLIFSEKLTDTTDIFVGNTLPMQDISKETTVFLWDKVISEQMMETFRVVVDKIYLEKMDERRREAHEKARKSLQEKGELA